MDADILIQAIEDADYVARDYSGRNMYGKRCVGFTCDDLFAAGVKLTLAVDEEHREELAELYSQTDSMGRYEIILYFPGVAWPEGRYHDEEDEDEDAA